VFVALAQILTDANRKATREVVEIWKGEGIPRIIDVLGYDPEDRSTAARTTTWKVGETYLVISETEKAPIVASGCSGTAPYTPTGSIPEAFAGAVDGDTSIKLPTASISADDVGGSGFRFFPIVLTLAFLFSVLLYLKRRMSANSVSEVFRSFQFEGAFKRSGEAELVRRRTGAFSPEAAEAERLAAVERAYGGEAAEYEDSDGSSGPGTDQAPTE
jgi:hypothetical protein